MARRAKANAKIVRNSAARGAGVGKSKRRVECERIARERAARQRMQTLRRRFMLGAGALVASVVIGSSLWGWKNGIVQQAVEQTQNGIVRLSAARGFVVKDMYLEGRETISVDAIRRAAGVNRGDPIFAASPEEVKERLESIPGVREAQVERVLPNALHIHIVERRPVAIWQHDGQLNLIDDKGVVMSEAAANQHPNLLLVVGDDAPEHAVELMRVLGTEKDLFHQVKAAIRVGNRRWNIRFLNGVEVKLPEHDIAAAWGRLSGMQQAQKVLERNVVAIDLRLSDRVYFKLPVSAPSVVAGGKASSAI